MKYEFVKNATDDFSLKYKDKEIRFKPDLEMTKKLQETNKTGRIKMLKDLAKDGLSLKDFTIEQKKNGKTYFDSTNKIELENAYIQSEMMEVINNICKERLGLTLEELLVELELNTQEEQEKFAGDLGASLMGRIPS